MRTGNTIVTTALAICMIILTTAVLLTIGSEDNTKRKIVEGVLMLICLFAFTASVIMREQAANKA